MDKEGLSDHLFQLNIEKHIHCVYVHVNNVDTWRHSKLHSMPAFQEINALHVVLAQMVRYFPILYIMSLSIYFFNFSDKTLQVNQILFLFPLTAQNPYL